MLSTTYMKEKHTMNKTITLTVLSLFLAINSSALAVSTKQSPITSKAKIESTQDKKSLVFKGVVKRHDEGTALFTENGVYPLKGGDFSMIIGETVNIIGELVNDGKNDSIAVARVQYLKN